VASFTRMSALDNEDLYIFGYGSLCWRPSEDLAQARVCQGFLDDPRFVRVWAQYSTDHRGNEKTYGCVCNLLRTDELASYYETQPLYPLPVPPNAYKYHESTSGVLGSLYLLPAATKAKTLADLDVREKGGYEREIVQVLKIDPDSPSSPPTPVSALLYRGSTTPDEVTRSKVGNFWARILYDIDYAVYTFASSVGPSGWNGDYILNLDTWLKSMDEKYKSSIPNLPSDPATMMLSERLRSFLAKAKEEKTGILFAYGVGNNEHEQLGISNPSKSNPPSRPFDPDNMDQIANGLWESAIPLPEYIPPHEPVKPHSSSAVPRVELLSINCGGSHTALITKTNQCYSFGSNAASQLPPSPSPNIRAASLGHAHTLLLTKSDSLLTFGSNSHGQCTPPISLLDDSVAKLEICAGPHTSSCITADGIAHVWGCSKYNQSGTFSHPSHPSTTFVQVALGMRHTILLDSKGAVYAVGDNRRLQLGSQTPTSSSSVPTLVPLPPVSTISCGWSHCIAVTKTGSVYGWGRNDHGQLGLKHANTPCPPTLLPNPLPSNETIKKARCGPEYTAIMSSTGQPYGCGWNEHGTLGVADTEDRTSFVEIKVDGSVLREGVEMMGVGGAHIFVA